jgi:hypothetical protein
MKIIVAGGRDFNNYELLKEKLDELIGENKEIEIVSGMARGADTLGVQYANERGYEIKKFPAQWDKYGKSEGYRRNEEMANYGDTCICFWDTKSKGTKHMIDLSNKYNLNITVIEY